MENVNVFPQLYKHRIDANRMCSLVIAVTLNRKVVATEKLNKKVLLKDWDDDKKICRSNNLLNALIKQRISSIENEITRRQVLGEKITAELIKKIVDGNKYELYYPYAENLIKTKTLKDGRNYDKDTQRRYTDEVERLKQFKSELYFTDLTPTFLKDYKIWLQNVYRKKDGSKLHKTAFGKPSRLSG